ncbi:hypothetical protein FRX31_019568 [Thalictrum thalictroides]|uniref:Uncharacterized protein n=1 Tax=Thalictrum thalictroides TaxID=46969 RepID=A0A7J6W104_THATH|nr:hypothetical protein FRX31_019568 [Thalictrum thalictroides]
MSIAKKRKIEDFFDIKGVLPERYLGVPLFRGEAAIGNFLWSGDLTQRRAITLKWESVCKPREEGGLGIRKLRELNLSLLMKLAWQLLEQKTNWSKFMTAKFKNKKGNWVNYHKSTSTWGGIKWALQEMKPYIGWIVGDGTNIDLWRDSWAGQAISDRVQFDWTDFRARLSDIITDGHWSIPSPLGNSFSNLGIQLDDVPPPMTDRTLVFGSQVRTAASQ